MCDTRPAVDGRLRPMVCLECQSGFAGSIVLRLTKALCGRLTRMGCGLFSALAAWYCELSHMCEAATPVPLCPPDSVRVPSVMAFCGLRFFAGCRQSSPSSAAGFTPM